MAAIDQGDVKDAFSGKSVLGKKENAMAVRRKTRQTSKQGAESSAAGVVRGPGKVPVRLRVNGSMYVLDVEPRCTLLDALRSQLHFTGTKKVCNMGECGACTILLNGRAVYSCLLLAVECEGHDILTIEGLSEGDRLDPIQQAFIEEDAFQCGFCTPGQIMSVRALLHHNPSPSVEEIQNALSGNLCRCGAYPRILAAAQTAARAYQADKSGRR
jgi:xanthine dehydrogenase YagT iron-sulfur-binding subunit